MSAKTYARGRDAARAARKSGLKDDQFTTVKIGGRFGWERLSPTLVPPVGPKAAPAPAPAKAAKAAKNGRAARFLFSDVGLSVGTEIFSTLKENEKATVTGDRHITFRGSLHTLSSAALVLARETGRDWPRIQGPLYWTYQGRKLGELRA